jgi:excisionase family DNA binding protein
VSDHLALLVDEVVDRLTERLRPLLAPVPAEQSAPWRLLTTEEAAARFGRSERWVRDRVKRGELAYVRLDGGALAFDEDDLRAFAQARRVSAEGGLALAGRLHPVCDAAAGEGLPDRHRLSKPRVSA